jgi:hypothetical protein
MERMIQVAKDDFLVHMDRIHDRFDSLEKRLERIEKGRNFLDGDRLLDNQDLAFLLKVSYRTLQRYRSSKKLIFYRIHNKTFYKESDVHRFIRDHMHG